MIRGQRVRGAVQVVPRATTRKRARNLKLEQAVAIVSVHIIGEFDRSGRSAAVADRDDGCRPYILAPVTRRKGRSCGGLVEAHHSDDRPQQGRETPLHPSSHA
jgi:hypothetical protein